MPSHIRRAGEWRPVVLASKYSLKRFEVELIEIGFGSGVETVGPEVLVWQLRRGRSYRRRWRLHADDGRGTPACSARSVVCGTARYRSADVSRLDGLIARRVVQRPLVKRLATQRRRHNARRHFNSNSTFFRSARQYLKPTYTTTRWYEND